ncbi:hypothetical protein ACFXEL_31620 [Streptomyces sp. NPDC059382]
MPDEEAALKFQAITQDEERSLDCDRALIAGPRFDFRQDFSS